MIFTIFSICPDFLDISGSVKIQSFPNYFYGYSNVAHRDIHLLQRRLDFCAHFCNLDFISPQDSSTSCA